MLHSSPFGEFALVSSFRFLSFLAGKGKGETGERRGSFLEKKRGIARTVEGFHGLTCTFCLFKILVSISGLFGLRGSMGDICCYLLVVGEPWVMGWGYFAVLLLAKHLGRKGQCGFTGGMAGLIGSFVCEEHCLALIKRFLTFCSTSD